MIIRLCLRWEEEKPAIREAADFESCLLRPKSPWRGLLLSAALHCAVAPVLPAVLEFVPTIGWVEPQRRTPAVEALVLHLPEQVYRPYWPPKPLPQTNPAATDTDPGDPLRAPVPEESGFRTYANRAYEVAGQSRAESAEQTLLQPRIPLMDEPQDIRRLPHLSFWSPQLNTPPPVKRIVLPGWQVESSQPALLAPPTLDLPNVEPKLSDLQMRNSVPATANPALPVPPANTMPLRTADARKAESERPPALDRNQGDAAGVIALNSRPAAPSKEVTVPPVSQVGQLPLAGENKAGAAAASDGARGQEHPAVPPPLPAGAGPSQPAPAALAHANAASEIEAAAGVPVRVVHPENGVFDVVLVQSSGEQAVLAEVPLPLNGRPIYTVYLRVGTPKEWILQYCVPQQTSFDIKQGGAVVQLGNPAPVKPPYPKVSVVPPPAVIPRNPKLVVHGFLTETGVLRGLGILGKDEMQLGPRLISYLQQWEFRPATRDGKPVEIEIVLIIPAFAG
jgi:hypothetical protein